MTNRKKAEAVAIKRVKAIEEMFDPSLRVTNLYKEAFRAMSDKEFQAWISRLEAKEDYLSIILPNFTDPSYDDEKVRKLLEEDLGIPLQERVYMRDEATQERILTPRKYTIIKEVSRRQSQHLTKKISVAKDAKTVDMMTGQVTGESKGGRLSLQELRLITEKGLTNSALELIKARGGDTKANQAMLQMIREKGTFSTEDLEKLNSVPVVTESLRALLFAAHYDNNLPTDRTVR